MQASRFVYDGKEASNYLLIEKARSSVRQSSTGEWRKWTVEDDDDENEVEPASHSLTCFHCLFHCVLACFFE